MVSPTARRYDPDVDAASPAGEVRHVPEATAILFPVYQRVLGDMIREGRAMVSSEQLAVRAGVTAAKVRRDLSLLGSFGTRGTGYDTAFLLARIDDALGSDRDWPLVVVGIGNLGRALVNSQGFSSRGFRVAALYDVSPAVVGTTVGPVVVRHVDALDEVSDMPIAPIGVVATPASAAQRVTDALVAAGVRSILNFAPCVLSVPDGIFVRSVDLSRELQVISFYQARGNG
jgi:redox-sensing transcriptional repressor